ncbi:MAG: ribosome silencing factor [Chlamydiales bacterium]|nr:ribosome silencing factor [Chlamydiia bacterium]MCP5508395.1 ribosome silencing factor [Chlamydiales bacterium]
MVKSTEELLNVAAQAIYDKQGFNIFALDLRGISTMTDYFIVAEGNVDRHVQALAKTIVETLEKEGAAPLRREGEEEGRWVVLDFGFLVVHLFVPELREKYQLEQLWAAGNIVDLIINTGPNPTIG